MLETLKDFFLFLPEAFIMLHTMFFEMIEASPSIFEDDGFVMAFLWLLLTLGMFVAISILDLFVIAGIFILINEISILLCTKEVTRQQVVGTVTSKEHFKEPTNFEYNVALKIPISHHHSAKYNVSVEYDSITETFDSKKLFKKYKKNDRIPLILVENIDKNGIPIKQKLELPE